MRRAEASGEDRLLGRRASQLVEQARAELGHMTPSQRVDGLRAVRERLAYPRKALGPAALGLLAAATGAVAIALLLPRPETHRAPSPPPITFQIEGGEVTSSGAVTATTAETPTIRFSEGTTVALLPRARARLRTIDDRGARLEIEDGEAHVAVTPRRAARWLFDAGPFLITVRGTVFTAAWDAGHQRLDVQLGKGLVSVDGPLADGIAVRGGQHLTVDLVDKEIVLREVPGDVAPERSEGPAAPAPDERSSAVAPTSPAPASPARSADTRERRARRSWSSALAMGNLDAILRAAERRGVETWLAEGSSDDLAALADAARYRRRPELARRALLAQRRRFPGSPRAHEAAFLLGRLDEAARGGSAHVLGWYDRYLEEAPSGRYASEALGRKMMVVRELHGAARARRIAEEYLRRFPGGTYAGAARAVRASE